MSMSDTNDPSAHRIAPGHRREARAMPSRRQALLAGAGGAIALAGAWREATAGPGRMTGAHTARALQATPAAATAPIVATYRVVAEYPHDRRAYTQGLVYLDGVLYEGTGLYGRSSLRRVDLESGAVLQSYELDPRYFGEGIAIVGDRIFQLTWKNRTCLVYDRESFQPLTTLYYDTEGWGLTTDGSRLIMSDGTSRLVFRDPRTLEETGHIDVAYDEQAVPLLNELELVDGEIWANVYRTDVIARIDAETGQVQSWIDLTGLLSERERKKHKVDVLNGIAHDPASGRLFVTGKLWPILFEIEIIDPASG
jgi:glutamine cyclotransferase